MYYAIAKQEWKSLMLKFNVTVNKQNNLSQLAEICIPTFKKIFK